MCNYVAYNRFYKRRFFTFIAITSDIARDQWLAAKLITGSLDMSFHSQSRHLTAAVAVFSLA